MNKKVFVVTEHYEWENQEGDSVIVGVYATKELAQKAMKKAFNMEKEDWAKNIHISDEDNEMIHVVESEDDIDEKEYDESCSLYNLQNEIDYYVVFISETPLITE